MHPAHAVWCPLGICSVSLEISLLRQKMPPTTSLRLDHARLRLALGGRVCVFAVLIIVSLLLFQDLPQPVSPDPSR